MKPNYISPLIVIGGILLGAIAICFYFLFAEDFHKFQREQEMGKCIREAQGINSYAFWNTTPEGKACIDKYQDVWLKN